MLGPINFRKGTVPSSKPVISDEPVVFHFDDALQLLRDAGVAPEDQDDLIWCRQLRLGELVKDKHGVDFFVVDRYPSSIRPFYTMLDPSDDTRSNSSTMGQEICSGAQRVHDPALLRDQLRARAASLSPSDAIDARVRVCAPTHASAAQAPSLDRTRPTSRPR